MNRRNLLIGLGAALAAPAVVRAESLMRVAALRQTVKPRAMVEFRPTKDGWEVVEVRQYLARIKGGSIVWLPVVA